jgi:hypothetical protein
MSTLLFRNRLIKCIKEVNRPLSLLMNRVNTKPQANSQLVTTKEQNQAIRISRQRDKDTRAEALSERSDRNQ